MRFIINGLKYDTENMEKVANQKGKFAFDTYGRLRNESRGSNNRRGSEKPFNEICTG